MSRRKETQLIEKVIVVAKRCDHCHAELPAQRAEDWKEFTSHHSDWGNDSVDSWDSWDACSGSCYLALVERIVNDYGVEHRRPTLTVDGMSHRFALSLIEKEAAA